MKGMEWVSRHVFDAFEESNVFGICGLPHAVTPNRNSFVIFYLCCRL